MKSFYFLLIVLFMTSCKSTQLLPSSYDESVTAFNSYEGAMRAYEAIVPYDTSIDELKGLGFDIGKGRNVEALTYLDVSKQFMHNPAINKEDLPEGVLDCLKAKNGCQAYRFKIENVNKQRYGSFWADVLEFRKKTHHTGWMFETMVVIVDGKVAYKLQSGLPNVDKKLVERQPLGPLQDLRAKSFF